MVAREAVAGEPGGLDNRVAEFANFLVRTDRSPATVAAYQWGLDDLCNFLESQGIDDWQRIPRAVLEAWQDRLIAVRMRPRSRSLAATAARQFFKWMADHDYCDSHLKDWLATVRVRPLKPKPIPAEDLDKLLKHFEPRPAGLRELRNRAMFLVYLTTGLRVSEGLQLPRVGYERIEVRQKGGSEKLVTVPAGVQPVVRDYLAARVDSSPALFVTHPSAERMTPGGVRQVWVSLTAELGLAPFTTHQLRHTFATQLLAQGIDIRVVAELMGHKNMQSIMGYTQVLETTRQAAEAAIERVVRVAPERTLPPDPRALTVQSLGKVKRHSRRGRPRFQLVP